MGPTATFSIKDFNKYEKVVSQFLSKGKGVFNTTGFKIEFNPDNTITMYYNGASALASYRMPCQNDIGEKIISTDYFRFTQILKALGSEGIQDISFSLKENASGILIKIDSGTTHIDLPAFPVVEEFAKELSYSEKDITCTFEDIELYNAAKVASSFLSSDAGSSVFVNSTAISNDTRYVYVAKKKWGVDLPRETSLSKQNLDIYSSLKVLDEKASYKHISSDKTFVHMSSEDNNFNMQIGEPTPIIAAPTEEDLEGISTFTVLTELTAGQILSIINFFLSTGIFDGQKWFPLTIQSIPKEHRIKFTVKNTQYTSAPSLNVERFIENIDNLGATIEDTISADILKIFLSMLDGTTSLKIYTDSTSNGMRFETVDQDLYLAKFS